MEYNTTRNKIVTKEYGRSIQRMVEYVMNIEDRELRNQQAKAVIKAMAALSNGSKKTADFWQKLWDEIFVISDFKLDIDSPFPIPRKKNIEAKPQNIPYPKNKIQFPTYGKNIETVINKLSEQEDSPERNVCVEHIAVYLKSLYLLYNRDSVSDDLIREHLNILSNGKLHLREDFVFPSTKSLLKDLPDNSPVQKKKTKPAQKQTQNSANYSQQNKKKKKSNVNQQS